VEEWMNSEKLREMEYIKCVDLIVNKLIYIDHRSAKRYNYINQWSVKWYCYIDWRLY